MAKIYSKTYNVNYASIAKASAPLAVPSGSMVCFRVPFPSEGFMERVVVYQATGTPVDFEVELLNSKVPYPVGEYSSGDLPNDELESYRIQMPPTAPLSQTAGLVLTLVDDEYGQSFRNIDGGWTLNERYIYLLINPQSAADDTTWNVMLQCRTDIG